MDEQILFSTLAEHGVEFVVVNPVAALALCHEAPFGEDRFRDSLELCFRQQWSNCESLTRALEDLQATMVPRQAAPLSWAGELRRTSRRLCFRSTAGALTLLPDVQGIGDYESVLPLAEVLELDGIAVRLLLRPRRLDPVELAIWPGSRHLGRRRAGRGHNFSAPEG